ncbi:MAG TPA: hypothetical protein VK666_16240, partial [Chryseolinea sp.]|nr:hypothetical protein [Chryseolinea sp.]
MEGKVLPAINYTSAFVPGFVSISEREGFWERFRGTMGRRVKEEIKSQVVSGDVETSTGN